MAERVDLSLVTLCCFVWVGLMPRVHRLPNGHRCYSESDVEWLKLVNCLRETGMPIRQIQRYAELFFTGDATFPKRVALLHRDRTSVVVQIAESQHNLEHLDGKLTCYADIFGVTTGEPVR